MIDQLKILRIYRGKKIGLFSWSKNTCNNSPGNMVKICSLPVRVVIGDLKLEIQTIWRIFPFKYFIHIQEIVILNRKRNGEIVYIKSSSDDSMTPQNFFTFFLFFFFSSFFFRSASNKKNPLSILCFAIKQNFETKERKTSHI